MVYNRIDKSAVAEHINKNKEHNINFNKVKILNKEQNYRKKMIKEAIEIEKCPAKGDHKNGILINLLKYVERSGKY